MHCFLRYIRSYLKSVLGYKFLILDTYLPDIYIYMSKGVRIRGYFAMPEWVREQKKVRKHWTIWMWLDSDGDT
jgi:hypothetical protein